MSDDHVAEQNRGIMTAVPTTADPMPAGPLTRTVFLLAAVVTAAAVVLGSVVCATDSSAACPNWPGCYIGKITPKGHLNPVLEFVHRVVAVSCGPLLLAAALLGVRSRDARVRMLPWIALAGAMVAGVLGMLTVKRGISKALAAFDLGSSLMALLAITVATVCVLRGPRETQVDVRSRIAWAAIGGLVTYHVLSIAVAGPGSLTRCVSWPVWRIIDIDASTGLQRTRLVLAAFSILLAAGAVVTAVRRSDTRPFGFVVAALMVVELVLGPTVVAHGASLPVKGLYAAVAGTILTGLGWIAALGSTPER